MQSTETEINYLPEYWDWDYATPTGVGCGENGTLYFSINGNRVLYDLDACAFSRGFNMTGKGFYDLNADRFSLTVTVTGYQSCRIKYERVIHKTTSTETAAVNKSTTRAKFLSPSSSNKSKRDR